MFSRITQTVKRAWDKTVQEFHEFEAQHDAKQQDKRRAEQARARRYMRLRGRAINPAVSAITDCNNGANMEFEMAIDSEMKVDGDDRKKRLKLENGPATGQSCEPLDPSRRPSVLGVMSPKTKAADVQQYKDRRPMIESTEPTRETRQSSRYSLSPVERPFTLTRSACRSGVRPASTDADSTNLEKKLRKKIAQLERELRKSKHVIQRLHEQLEEHDDYIRPMELDRSRAKESRVYGTRDGKNDPHDGIEYSNDTAVSLANRPRTGQSQTQNYTLSPKRKSFEPDSRDIDDDKSFEQMSPVPLTELIAHAGG
ncbi:hypothetical protein POJ06DRAFT_254697 [Lipomyces tetrasporus]|uniref:Uncharacterized protein n=1 Tax=Lipomyces tetrasporus TaxID=54092 RepID=A0AAD7QRA0_9ASCO|nr:uncharacterized protein POJ06DRAFT_254697 [Lipomyces tetrasporus]KAJ8099858.1 hypothetical protein POJ06DRAFT_254697 [Lipomyces tetrasporus]